MSQSAVFQSGLENQMCTAECSHQISGRRKSTHDRNPPIDLLPESEKITGIPQPHEIYTSVSSHKKSQKSGTGQIRNR